MICDKGVENLRYAIVQQAVDDYVDLLAGFTLPTPKDGCTTTQLEKFFLSEWYRQLCDIDGRAMIQMLKEKAKTMVLKFTIKKEKGNTKYHVVDMEGNIVPDVGLLEKKKALHKAVERNGLSYNDYMKVRRRDGVKVD